jgi:hypothetical protein
MPTYSVHIDKPTLNIHAGTLLTRIQMVQLAGVAIDTLKNRVARRIDVNDQPMPAYSPSGPLYIPITGVGTILKEGAKKPVARNTSTLSANYVFTKKDVNSLRKAGLVTLTGPKAKTARIKPPHNITPLGHVTPSGKSIKVKNWEAYKKLLGKSGARDLEVKGHMLAAISIVDQDLSTGAVTIGFLDQLQELKAQGNSKYANWWGLSDSDSDLILRYARDLVFFNIANGHY